jgi:hypothetical protein
VIGTQPDDRTVNSDSKFVNDEVVVKIRWFVVVQSGKRSCTCLYGDDLLYGLAQANAITDLSRRIQAEESQNLRSRNGSTRLCILAKSNLAYSRTNCQALANDP